MGPSDMVSQPGKEDASMHGTNSTGRSCLLGLLRKFLALSGEHFLGHVLLILVPSIEVLLFLDLVFCDHAVVSCAAELGADNLPFSG